MARLRNFRGRKIVYEVLELCSFECVQNGMTLVSSKTYGFKFDPQALVSGFEI